MKPLKSPAVAIFKQEADLDSPNNKEALNAFLSGKNKTLSFFVSNDFEGNKKLISELENTYFKLVAYVRSDVHCYYDPLTECMLTSVVATT